MGKRFTWACCTKSAWKRAANSRLINASTKGESSSLETRSKTRTGKPPCFRTLGPAPPPWRLARRVIHSVAYRETMYSRRTRSRHTCRRQCVHQLLPGSPSLEINGQNIGRVLTNQLCACKRLCTDTPIAEPIGNSIATNTAALLGLCPWKIGLRVIT